MKLLSCLLILSLCSCGLLKAPFKVAGGVAKGTATLSRAAVTKPIDAHKERKARKQAEREKQEVRDAAARDAGPTLGGNPSLGSSPSLDSGGIPLPDPTVEEAAFGSDPPLPDFNQ